MLLHDGDRLGTVSFHARNLERGARSTASRVPRLIRRASASTVGASKSALIGNDTPKTLATRARTRPAKSEWPPKSKKLSKTPMSSTSSKSAQMLARTSSVELRGATNSPPATLSPRPIAANAGRSTLPWAVSGMRSRKM